ncbi:MAG: substrate-binding domain-containing protein [Chthoniobacterales bacterium]
MFQHIFRFESELQNSSQEAAPSSPSLCPTVSEKLERYGSSALSGVEHLTLIVGKEDLALALVSHLGSIKALSRASIQQLLQFLPRRKAETLVAALSMSTIAESEHARSEACDSPESVYTVCADLKLFNQEVLRVILLDARQRLITMIDVTKGSLNESLAYPRALGRFSQVRYFRRSSGCRNLVGPKGLGRSECDGGQRCNRTPRRRTLTREKSEELCLGPFSDDAVNEERFRGFAASVREAGFDCLRLLTFSTRRDSRLNRHLNWTLRRRLIKTIRSLRHPLGIFCYNDCVAADIVDACIEAGIQIPDQVALLGVDNDPVICDCVQVPLSSVRHDLEGMAYEAAALLDRLINGEAPPEIPQRIAPKGVVTRRSTELLAVEDPTVSTALMYIQAKFCEGNLSVGDVAAHCRVPRRSLERAFQREMQRTVLHEILRVRVNYAQKLLETTPLSVTDIAARSRFVNLNHFFRVFQGRTHLTPRKFQLARQLTVPSSVRA